MIANDRFLVALCPIRCHTEFSPLRLVRGVSQAQFSVGHLTEIDFKAGNIDRIISLNYPAVFSETWMTVFCEGSGQQRALSF